MFRNNLFYNSYNLLWLTVFLSSVETWWQLDLIVKALGQSMSFCSKSGLLFSAKMGGKSISVSKIIIGLKRWQGTNKWLHVTLVIPLMSVVTSRMIGTRCYTVHQLQTVDSKLTPFIYTVHFKLIKIKAITQYTVHKIHWRYRHCGNQLTDE